MTDGNGEFKGEAKAQLAEIYRILARMDSERGDAREATTAWQERIENRLEAHTVEEEGKLEEMREKLFELSLWRAKVMGYAAAVAAVVAIVIKFAEFFFKS